VTELARVAALFVEAGGHYFEMPDVDPWDVERDASRYAGPLPVVAHPPCAAWGRLRHLCTTQEHTAPLAPKAVAMVRTWGGVLEHPAHSTLFDDPDLRLPHPGEFLDSWGGFTIEINQCAWGHVAKKPTWLYVVGVHRGSVHPRTGGTPTHCVGGGKWRGTPGGPRLLVCSKRQRRITPPDLARWLVDLAARCSVEHGRMAMDTDKARANRHAL
jgi:hypothetical protein